MKKGIGIFIGMTVLLGVQLSAAVPAGYYKMLDGLSGEELKETILKLSKNHVVVAYNKAWDSFEKTDVRTFQGRDIWWDMYSNNIVYTAEHGALNIEHSVANSWWGGNKTGTGSVTAYSDLFLLNPSDAVANGKKGDNPPGDVIDARILDNGILRIGTPAQGQGGGSATVFEPADEYKGDFARAYFYVFSAYNDLTTWKAETRYVYDSDCNLQPWAVEMLLRWHREDPVDSKEINRNEEIYKLQYNRNPFIDYPELVEFIWGDRQNETFSLSSAVEATAIDRPEAPTFPGGRAVGVNTYTKRWWDGFTQDVGIREGELKLSYDGRDFYTPPASQIQFDPADEGDSHVIKAYTTVTRDGYTLRSQISTLTLISRDPYVTEYSTARWEKVTSAYTGPLEGQKFVIVSSNSNNAMSSNGGTTANKYLEPAGLVDIENDYIVELPLEAAVVEFASVGDGKYRVMVNDIRGNYKGSWNATGKNAMQLKNDTYTAGKWEGMGDGDTFRFRFDSYGSLQFNKTQSRYVNYEDNSNQTPIYLYRYVDMEGGSSGIAAIEEDTPWAVGIDGCDIIAPEGSLIFDMNGRRVEGRNLGRGVYIVVGNGRSVKIMI